MTATVAAVCPRCWGRHSMFANDDGSQCMICAHRLYDAPALMAQRSEDRRRASLAGRGWTRGVHGYSIPYIGGASRLMGREIQIELKKWALPVCPYCTEPMVGDTSLEVGGGKYDKLSKWYSCQQCPRRILIARNSLYEPIGWS